MSYWITDRPPTEADGDKDGDVWVRVRPKQVIGIHWSYVGIGTPWRRSQFSLTPAPQPEPEPIDAEFTQPRRFVSISRTILNGNHIIDAIDDEGVAWCMRFDTQPHRPAVPPKDLKWQQLLPLPARELPPF